MKLLVFIAVLVQFVVLAVIAVPPPPPISPNQCGPKNGLNQQQCLELKRLCYTYYHIGLKWTGTGSVINGHRERDGGCQCTNYCGYHTRKPCLSDPLCFWLTDPGVCINRHTHQPGQPMPAPCPTIP